MTILAWPAALPAPTELRLGIRANTQVSGPSPFTGTSQTLEYPGARWVAQARFRLNPANQRIMAGFLAALGGRAGRFTWSPPYQRQGDTLGDVGASPAGIPRIRTAGQSGKLLDTTGWDRAGYVARQGDLLGFLNAAGRAQLRRVTGDVAASEPTSTNLQVYSGAIASGISAGAFTLGSNTINSGSVADPLGGSGAIRLGASATGNDYLRSSLSVTGNTAYVFGVDVRRQSGSSTAGDLLGVDEYNGSSITWHPLISLATAAPGSSWARFSAGFTTAPSATTLYVYWLSNYTAGNAFDIFAPQIEQRSVATARIVTAGAALTRTQSLVIPIAPPLRTPPNANEPLVLSAPPAVWMLSADDASIDLLPGLRGDVSLTFEEAIY